MAQNKSNVDLVLKELGFGKTTPELENVPLEMPHSPDEAHDRVAWHSFESRINDILQPRSTHFDDRIFLLDFTASRIAMGDEWERQSNAFHSKIHEHLEDNLIAHDIYFQRDAVSYFVIISGIREDMAFLKIHTIADDIRKTILQQNDPKAIKICRAIVSWPKMVKLEDIPSKNDVIHSMVAAEDSHRNFVFSQDVDSSSATFFSDVKCVFRPMLSVRTRIISTYICIPVKPNGHGGYYSGYEMLGPHPSIDKIFELDTLVQEAADKELQRLVDTNMRSLLALPVHFETLASHRRQQYLTRARELFERYTNRIVFELVGAPDHIPQSRMLEFTSALKPHCRAIIARFPPSHGAFESYRSVGLHAVGVDLYSPDKAEKTIFKSLQQFIEHAQQTQLKTYAHGIHSVSLYTAAVTAGFDYLDGYALSSVADEAKDIVPFSYDMLYKSMTDKKSPHK